MQLGKQLLRLCRERGWSVARLARESGVPQPTLHGWTTGRTNVSLDQLKRVSEALEVPIHVLAFGSPDPFETDSGVILKEIFSGDIRVTLHRIERARPKEKSKS